MKFRTTLTRVGFALSGLLVAVAILEVGCRLYTPQPPLMLTKDLLNRGRFTTPGIHHNHQSEFSTTIEVNSDGFVDYEWADDQSTDILLIGDSFVQGAQVPMDTSIGRLLHNDLDKNVKSIGVPGAGTITELLLLEQWIDRLNPEVVLVGFLPSNDVLNNHPELESKSDKPSVNLSQWRSSNQLTIQLSTPSVESPGLSTHSHFIRWFIRSIHTNQIQQSKLHKGDGIPIDWHVYNPEVTSTWNEAWSITEVLFQRIHELCSRKDTILKVVLFPSIEEISPAYQQHIHKTYPTTANFRFTDGIETRSREMLISAGIPSTNILSLYPSFSTHESPDSLYYKLDHHWTTSGHSLASETIKNWLESQ